MPKIKSHRGAAKRFKKTGTGKFLRGKAFKRHILTSKPTPRKRTRAARKSVNQADRASSSACCRTTKQNLELQTLNQETGFSFEGISLRLKFESLSSAPRAGVQ
jgi:large subunit ribosomal protein L35